MYVLWHTPLMVADRGWDALGLKPSRDGWLSEDPELIDRLVKDGRLGSGSLAFWLKRDVRAPKVWAIWSVAGVALTLGVLWRDLPAFGFGVIAAVLYLRNFFSFVSAWGRGNLAQRTVYALEPHRAPGYVHALVEGEPVRVAMKENVAQTALMRLGRFEVLFFQEDNLELAFRPLQVNARS